MLIAVNIDVDCALGRVGVAHGERVHVETLQSVHAAPGPPGRPLRSVAVLALSVQCVSAHQCPG